MLSAIDKVYSLQDAALPTARYGAVSGRVGASGNRSPFETEAAVVNWSPEAQKYLQSQKDSQGLSEADQQKVQELKKEDQKVRTHEQQHLSASGGFATGGPHFEFTTGPDGNQYAVGGHVNIDTSPVPGDPEATIQKAETIQRAALAPSDPSGEDRAVAAQAAQMEMKARLELERPANPSDTSSGPGSMNVHAPGCRCGTHAV